MKTLFIAASAVALVAVPAQAQLLGGSGGLGGMAGGTLGGGFPAIGGTLDSVGGTLGSTLDAGASSSGDQQIDRRSGRVQANRRADARTSAGVAPLVDNPVAPVTGQASGAGSAAGEGSADAQLIGTDAIGGLAAQGMAQGMAQAQGTAAAGQSAASGVAAGAQGAAGSAASSAGMLGGMAGGLAGGSAGGAASGSGSATGSLGNGLAGPALAAAGSSAANGQGAFAVAPGMDVFGASGDKIGEVHQVVANSNGMVSQVIVEQGGREVAIPASSLQGSGSGLYAAEGNAAAN